MQALLDHGASPDVATRVGGTAIMVASRSNHGEIVEILLERGADLSCRGQEGLHRPHRGREKGPRKRLPTLLAAGADPNAADGDERTSLFLGELQRTCRGCAKASESRSSSGPA